MARFFCSGLGKAIAILPVVFLILGCAASDPWADQELSEPPPVDPSLVVEASAAGTGSEGTLEQRAAAGDPRAQYQLGMNYYYGIDAPEDRKLAELWIGRAAEQGSREAKLVLASLQRAQASRGGGRSSGSAVAQPAAGEQRHETAMSNPAPTTPHPVFASAPDAPATAAKDAAWIRAQPAANYTVQLLGGRDRSVIEDFIQAAMLQGDLAYFRTRHDGGDWYSVVFGSFADRARAEQAKRSLPKSFLAAGPWVRPFEAIQAIMSD